MIAKGFCEKVVMAGFGGQGIMLLGKLLAQAAMRSGRQVTYMPSYGAEVRRGTANCMVTISDEPIASPLVSRPHSLIVLNTASYNKFGPRLKSGGLLVANSSLIKVDSEREDIEVIFVPADDIAVELDSPRSANMVMLGAYLQRRSLIGLECIAQCLSEVLARRYHNTIDTNVKALRRGVEWARETVLK